MKTKFSFLAVAACCAALHVPTTSNAQFLKKLGEKINRLGKPAYVGEVINLEEVVDMSKSQREQYEVFHSYLIKDKDNKRLYYDSYGFSSGADDKKALSPESWISHEFDLEQAFETDKKNRIKRGKPSECYSMNSEAFPLFFYKCNNFYKNQKRIFFFGNIMIIAAYINENDDPLHVPKRPEKGGYPILYVYSPSQNQLAEFTRKQVREMVYDYMEKNEKAMLAAKETAKKEQEAAKAKAAAERLAKYGLKDKKIKKVALKFFLPKYLIQRFDASGHFDIITTLEDGTVITTGEINQGYLSDYEIDVKGSVGCAYTDGGSRFCMSNTEVMKDDKITVNVKSKYQPEIAITEEVVMTYDYDKSWTVNEGGRGYKGNGPSLKCEVKRVKHKVTGEDLVEYRVTKFSGEVVAHIRLKPTVGLTIGNPGWNGEQHASSSAGIDGKNGGNVEIIRDPNAKDVSISVNNSGGNAGFTRSGLRGATGVAGRLTERVAPVNF